MLHFSKTQSFDPQTESVVFHLNAHGYTDGPKLGQRTYVNVWACTIRRAYGMWITEGEVNGKSIKGHGVSAASSRRVWVSRMLQEWYR